MANSQQRSFRSLVIFGSIFIFVGAFIFLISINLISVPEEDIYAPRWVLTSVGLTFALAGVLVVLNGLKSGLGHHALYKWIYNGVLLMFMIFFAAPFNWVAFGPGEREFSSSTSVGAVSVSQSGEDFGGRLVFGIGAILMDILILYLVYRAIQGRDLSQGG